MTPRTLQTEKSITSQAIRNVEAAHKQSEREALEEELQLLAHVHLSLP